MISGRRKPLLLTRLDETVISEEVSDRNPSPTKPFKVKRSQMDYFFGQYYPNNTILDSHKLNLPPIPKTIDKKATDFLGVRPKSERTTRNQLDGKMPTINRPTVFRLFLSWSCFLYRSIQGIRTLFTQTSFSRKTYEADEIFRQSLPDRFKHLETFSVDDSGRRYIGLLQVTIKYAVRTQERAHVFSTTSFIPFYPPLPLTDWMLTHCLTPCFGQNLFSSI